MIASTGAVPANPEGAAKILVLGATGATGRLIVSQAVARGYEVTVLVRSAEKASDITGARRRPRRNSFARSPRRP